VALKQHGSIFVVWCGQ